ncbi:hypothetical protein NX059_011517 [Plenodomus lindquistii]|nr:hypothetical protein NX059_011517 [Plenodomus lindquistii]
MIDSPPLPYLPLTQICQIIRQEFRPLWLSTNCFPFFALEGYIKTFYPSTLRKLSEEAKARFDKSFNPAGTLRVYVGKDRIASIDILRLLKLKLRFPDFTITPVLFPLIKDDATIAALTLLFNNSAAKWVRWIESRKIKQVRVEMMYNDYAGSVHIVVGERWAEPWMKVLTPSQGMLQGGRMGQMREELGLGKLEWTLSFGVDYS